jgi:hypothetical protein
VHQDQRLAVARGHPCELPVGEARDVVHEICAQLEHAGGDARAGGIDRDLKLAAGQGVGCGRLDARQLLVIGHQLGAGA